MQISKLQKSWLLFSAIISLLMVINIVGIIWYFYPHSPDKHHENIFAGRVSGISADFITTIDINKITKSFSISSTTRYFSGRQVISKEELNLNDLVIVTPTRGAASTSLAAEVRVMRNNDKKMQ